MKARVNLNYFVNDCLLKPFFDCNSAQMPSRLIYLAIYVTPRPLALFKPKITAIKFQKRTNICLNW